MYRTARIAVTMITPIRKPVDILNMDLSISSALGFFFDFGSISPNKMMSPTQARNTTPILFKKGMDGTRYFNAADSGILVTVAASAPGELERFQKKPIRNMARIPGEMKPVNS